jgi:PAS domain S-box-containing protein
MKLDKIFFKSRFARRIIIIFICCTIIPLLALSVLSYKHITGDLKDQNFSQLKRLAKSIGVSIYERLLFLETEIQLISSRLSRGSGDNLTQIQLEKDDTVPDRFSAMAVYAKNGNKIALFGDIDNFPDLSSDANRILENGKTTIITIAIQTEFPKTFLAAPIMHIDNTLHCLIGEVKIDYLWRFISENVLPAMTDYCILDSSQNILSTSFNPDANLPEIMASSTKDRISGSFSWQCKNKEYIAGFNKLFLRPSYSIAEWTVISTQSTDYTLRSLTEFRQIFPLVIILSLLIVLFLSTLFIQKSLNPLEKLKEGTHQIVDGNFSDKVKINSGDEFEELAVSFNKMTAKLSHQFNELRLNAIIGNFSAKMSDTKELIAAIMDSIRQYLNFDRAALLLIDKAKSRVHYKAGYGYTAEEKKSLTFYFFANRMLNSENLIEKALISKQPVFSGSDNEGSIKISEGMPDFTAEKSNGISIFIPIVYENKSTGALILENKKKKKVAVTLERNFLMGLGSQIAVSLSNIRSYQKLQESEERFRKSFDHAASGISLIATDGRFLTANDYLIKMLGYEKKEFLNKTLADISNPGHFMAEMKSQKRLLNKEIDFDIYEKKFIHRSGEEIWGLVSISLLFNKNDKPLHYIMHVQNLSDLKNAEKNQKQLEGQLRQAQKIEAIGTLAGGIAHDFNNILFGIIGYSELGLLDSPENGKVRERFENILHASERAADLIKQILTFSRKGKTESKPVQISSILKEALKFLSATFPATIEIRQSISNEPGLVLSDPTQIHQIVMNLCTNAHHAMMETGGTLTVRLEHVNLSENEMLPGENLQPGPYLKLIVADNGCGIESENINRIFDPYFTTKHQDKGTGLGLSVVHGIVKNCRGEIRAQSAAGKGTTFEVLFPKIRNQIEDSEGSEPAELPTGSERILIVDDEAKNVDICKSMLERLGYHVRCTTSAEKALEEFRLFSDQFDLVITDMTMPKITGDRLALELLSIKPEIPVILSTGFSERITSEKAESLGIRKLLNKPFSINEVACLIRSTLDRS